MLTLDKFEEASEKVKEVTLETKLVYSDYWSQQTGNKVYLKPENMQFTGAYKVRGAYYKISTLSDEERAFKYERFISSKIPCVIFSTMTRPSQDMIDLAVKYNVPTFVTERTTSSFMAEIIRWLGVQLAPSNSCLRCLCRRG